MKTTGKLGARRDESPGTFDDESPEEKAAYCITRFREEGIPLYLYCGEISDGRYGDRVPVEMDRAALIAWFRQGPTEFGSRR